MLKLKPLEQSNFHHLVNLLMERGEAPEDYYRWKYLSQPSNGKPTGYVAYLNNALVGCIGIINRIYHAEDGKEYPATWFADWFVSDSARGKGIGEALMKEVFKNTPYNFGIPGPLKAQVVCKQAGYTSLPGLFHYSLYINSFRCGFKRFGGSFLVKFLRGSKSIFFSLPIMIKFLSIQKRKSSFTFGFPNEQQWEKQMVKLNSETPRLKRSIDFITWIGQMPISTNGKRSWWSIEYVDLFACGFIETDFWGLRRSIIFDIQSEKVEKSVWQIAAALSEQGVDWITFCYFDKSLSLKHWTKSALPLHVVAETSISKLHMADLDKDSSWRNFLFA
jgi:GNAT superfamily N-acetyltransferase